MMKMKEFNFGSVSRRHLRVRLYTSSWSFPKYLFKDHDFRFVCHNKVNSRCYCEQGQYAFFRTLICGTGISAWYSNYQGPIPCECDKINNE